MQRCTNKLYWLDQQAKDRTHYDWSDHNLDYPSRRRQYEVRGLSPAPGPVPVGGFVAREVGTEPGEQAVGRMGGRNRAFPHASVSPTPSWSALRWYR